jgi:hypothetical protein
MVTTAIKLAIASIAFVTLAESANAQGMPPQCAVRRDPVRCLCALQNGGTFTQRPGSRGRTLLIKTNRGYFACMRRHGRS